MMTASAKWTVRVYEHMPQFSAHAVESFDQGTVADNAAADARADGQVYKIVMPFARAVLPLSERGEVGVVVEMDGYAKMFGEFGGEREILPLGNIGRVEDNAGIWVKRTGRRDAYGTDIPVLPNGFYGLDKPVKDPWRICKRFCTLVSDGDYATWLVCGCADMSSADINGYCERS